MLFNRFTQKITPLKIIISLNSNNKTNKWNQMFKKQIIYQRIHQSHIKRLKKQLKIIIYYSRKYFKCFYSKKYLKFSYFQEIFKKYFNNLRILILFQSNKKILNKIIFSFSFVNLIKINPKTLQKKTLLTKLNAQLMEKQIQSIKFTKFKRVDRSS
ncbi:hypothetical protein TTHERM_001539702 (macronuclear) [Tetrahymena thermophila SB210]|uniref:Uncharacterized protein n=1 Tax=Tetrahymena thermophila (strain SB210) TaxID=312017 RepID=W7XE16_TETTS|nr:hypothetical protein TTHERM_001539702 [Tetrahymena thermophila SB210]EWS75872.1 hypothetical protein TTHERM_001539702 [Tetrahymena thermophila SB210]|eukprot:XP_012651595.1 hypothetical protein TTHERM_001539702 [Tetrahymena thermophila SB210]